MSVNELYKKCCLCPRNCGVNRLAGRIGFCGESAELRLVFAGIHKGEEPPLTGFGGSGTIFASGCGLRCVSCQNWQISGGMVPGSSFDSGNCTGTLGRTVSTEEFAAICLALQDKGAENINIVTGNHAAPALAEGLTAARNAGLQIPVLWNSSGYESPESLEIISRHVETWLPDLKTLDNNVSASLLNAPDYPQAATAAIQRMLAFCREKQSGLVMIRHLILPGRLEATRTVLEWFAEKAAGPFAALSLMTQYTPITGNSEKKKSGGSLPLAPALLNNNVEFCNAKLQKTNQGPAARSKSSATPSAGSSRPRNAPGQQTRSPPQRFLSEPEYDTILSWLGELGIQDGYCQELVTGSDWLPDFSRINPFSSNLSVPVWHFSHRFIEK